MKKKTFSSCYWLVTHDEKKGTRDVWSLIYLLGFFFHESWHLINVISWVKVWTSGSLTQNTSLKKKIMRHESLPAADLYNTEVNIQWCCSDRGTVHLLLLALSGSDADFVNFHVRALRVSRPPGGNHLQHAGGRPTVGLLPFKLQHQQVTNILLSHQQEGMSLIGCNFLLPDRQTCGMRREKVSVMSVNLTWQGCLNHHYQTRRYLKYIIIIIKIIITEIYIASFLLRVLNKSKKRKLKN